MKLQYQIVNDELTTMNNKYKSLLAQYQLLQQGNSSFAQSHLHSSSSSLVSDKSLKNSMTFNFEKLIPITDVRAVHLHLNCLFNI